MFSIKVIYFYLEKQIHTVIFNINKEKSPFKNAQKKQKTQYKPLKKSTETQYKPKNENLVQYFDFKWTSGNYKCVSSNEKMTSNDPHLNA